MNNCAFQYYDGIIVREDISEITINEAKKLWDKYYDDMVNQVKSGFDIEVAIWVNMKDKDTYDETFIWLKSPIVIGESLAETMLYPKFNIYDNS